MSRALQALGALLAAEPSGKKVSYEICLSSIQETQDLAGDLEAVTVEQALAVSTELQDQWKQSSNKLIMCSLQVAGYVLAEKSFTTRVSGEEQGHLLKSLAALLHSNSRKDEARVAFWCLSRQQLQPDMLQQHCKAMVSAIALGLVTSNKWASMQCVHHSLKCIARMSQQVPEALREAAHLWLPQLWRLLLVQPVTQYEQKADSKHSFAKLRQEALLTFNLAWSQPGGRPCEGNLSAALVLDLVGSKRAGQPADSDGLLKVIWDWTWAAWGSDAQTGAPGGKVAKGHVSESTILQAVTAVHAWGCLVELLGREFLRRDPPVGPPMLKLMEKLFTHTSSTRLPVATFAAWQKLCDAFATCGQLSKRQPLLLNPITFALKSDRRPAVHQAAMATWKHMVAHAIKASISASPASGAARSSLLASLLGPVLQVLIKMPPETGSAPPARPEPCQFLWAEAVKWLSDILRGSQLLVALTVAMLTRESGQSLSFLTEGLQAVKCLFSQLCSLAPAIQSTNDTTVTVPGDSTRRSMVPMKVLLFAQLSRVFITVPSLRTKSSETCLGDLLLLAEQDEQPALYQALTEVTSRKRAYKLNSTDLLHAYLLRLAADMHQTASVPTAASVEGNRLANLSLWKCLLAAAAVAVAHQAVEHGRKQVGTPSRPAARASGGAKGSKPASDVSCACQLLGFCLEELCQAAIACPDTVTPLICKMLEVIPGLSLASHGLLDLQHQLPLKALGACLLLPSEVTGGHEEFLPMLEAAWASLLSAISIQSFSGLSQSCIAEVLLQPLAAALKHKSTAVHDAAEDFWSSSGVQSALKGYEVGLVEAALALVGSQRSQAGNVGIGLQQQVQAEQPFGRSRVDSRVLPIRQGPLASPALPAAMATAHAAVTQAQKGSPAAPGGDGISDPGMLSSKKRSRQLKTPFDASQTEYVKIPSAVKRPCVEAMTDRQKEVLARQKAGAAREGILTYTTLDASQHTQHANAVPLSGPHDKKPTGFATRKPDLAGMTAVNAGHAEPAMHAEPASAAQPAGLSTPDKAQADLKPHQDPKRARVSGGRKASDGEWITRRSASPGQASSQQQLADKAKAAQTAEKAPTGKTPVKPSVKSHSQQLGTAAGKSAQKLTPDSTGISQQSPDRARGKSQKEGDGSVEGQTSGSGYKAGTWTGRLKSLFTLSGRESPTKSPLQQATEAAAKKLADADKPQAAAPAAAAPGGGGAAAADAPNKAAAAAAPPGTTLSETEATPSTQEGPASTGRENSPDEAAVDKAFAMAGCLARDLVPDSADQFEQLTVKGQEQANQEVDSHMAAGNGKRPAEGSPGMSDADKAAHKRARSDSPVGVRVNEQGVDRHGVERWRLSDADVQELDIFATQQATSSSQPDRRLAQNALQLRTHGDVIQMLEGGLERSGLWADATVDQLVHAQELMLRLSAECNAELQAKLKARKK
ncbi:hypothetical protein WJX79_003013 [Trebouxia sp. C0005]